jgi:kynureninase
MSFQRSDAIKLDAQDALKSFREEFHIPKSKDHSALIYFCGNSLGLQPRTTRQYVEQELSDWANYGVEGHRNATHPWYSYHELLTEHMAEIIGAKPIETVVMNTLTVNLHLMMVSFYKPTNTRHKILIEYSSFPSDRYAVESQLKFHGYDPKDSLIILKPEEGTDYISLENIERVFKEEGNQIALALIGSVNYYTGQAYPISHMTRLAHQYGCRIGFDLAHGAGNLLLNLHEAGPDFAIWCGYKYLNGGPGSLAGCFVHERHAHHKDLPRFNGWWGHNKSSRFKMQAEFDLMPGAEGWQLSNPPILPMACLNASLQVFAKAGMEALRKKSLALSKLVFELLDEMQNPNISIITPRNETERGCQISIKLKNADRSIFEKISARGVIADWREPDVIRIAPVPLYNTFTEVYDFVQILKEVLKYG